MKYIDLTHALKQNMPVYPGDPIPEINQVASVERDGYDDSQVKIDLHTGTHMDAPSHMLKGGKKLSAYSPDYFFGSGHLIDARGKLLDAGLLKGKKILKGDIIFIMTGLSSKFNSPAYYEDYPEISPSLAEKIIELGVKIIGLDTPSPDRPPFVIHKLLMKNDILIIENLTNLESLSEHAKFEVIALPAKFDAEAAPVRVVARIK